MAIPFKYKLINKQTGEEHLCDKIVLDGWDYYVSDAYGKPAIATNNPNNILNIPKVVDMIEFNEWCNKNYEFDNRCNQWFHGNGYYTTKELLQLWKEQRPKTLYYEQV